MLTIESLPDLQQMLRDAQVDGWLLYDFQGVNPVARSLMGVSGFITRRIFVWIPADGAPHALGHAIEPGPWAHWPGEWTKSVYSSWNTLESTIASMVNGKRIVMEYSAGDAVPYLDRVPAGVIEMVRAAGAVSIASSGELVTRFVAVWNESQTASHVRAAEIIAVIAKDAFTEAGKRARSGNPVSEAELQQWIRDRFTAAGLSTDHGPNVSAGANAANPHYEPSESNPRHIVEGDVVLIDLWATEPDGIYADQTWIASVGEPSARAQEIWRAVRDARDAAIAMVTQDVAAGKTLNGGAVDDAARNVIKARGFGEYFTHRTGHSIDPKSLHGAGPHLDNLETREVRLLMPGVGFSIEPGIYITGEIGMRSEVNVYLEEKRAVITPKDYQRELIVV